MEKVYQYGEKSVFVEQNTGAIYIQNSSGEIRIIDTKTQEGLTQLNNEFKEKFEEILGILRGFTTNKIPRLLTNPPFNTDLFIGRENDLNDIEAQYQDHHRLLVLVNGEGGIGKTTLAAKYWYAHADRYKHLAWLYADAGIGAALVTLKNALGVDFEKNDDFDAQIRRITEAINNLGTPCLLVFDNANNATDLKKYYTTLHQLPNCHILLTSRVRKLVNMKVHEVKPLTETDAVALFKNYYPDIPDADLPMLHDVLKAVGYNTLVTEVSAKNMAVFNRFSVQYILADLLRDLQAKGLLALKNKAVEVVYGSNILREAEPKDIIAAMYDLSSLNDAECYILSNFAVLPAENIAYTLLAALLNANEEALETPLSSLEEKGWLEYRKTDNTFKISPVIQEVTRSKNAERLLNDCRTLVNTLITGLANDNRHIDNYQQAALFARLGSVVIYALPIDTDLAYLSQNIGSYHKDTGNLYLTLQAYQKMLNIQITLCAAEPDNAHFKNGLAISYEKLGDTHSSLGNLDTALQYFEKRNKLSQELYIVYFQNVEFKKGLAISYGKLGETHISLGNLDTALGFFEQCNQLAKKLYSEYPTNIDFKNGLAISYIFLGNTHLGLGNLNKALSNYKECNELSKELYKENNQNIKFKNDCAISYEKLGVTYSRLGNLDKALYYFEECNKLSQALYASYQTNVSFKNSLAISYSKLGETHSSLGNLDKALEYFKIETKLFEELYAAYPQHVEFKNGLAISYSYLGNICLNLGDLNTALSNYIKCNELSRELFEETNQNIKFKNDYAISFAKLGNTYHSLSNLQKALDAYSMTNQIFKELYATASQNVDFKNGLAISYEKLGETHNSLGNLDTALRYFWEQNKLFKELYGAYPKNVSFKNGLAVSYSKLGEAHSGLDNLDAALQYFEEYNRLEKELYDTYPTNVNFKNGLALSYAKLGAVSRDELKDNKKAKAYFQEAEKLWSELVGDAPQYVQFQQFLEVVQKDIKSLD